MACEKGALEGAICARAHMRSNPKCPFSSFPIPLPTLRTFHSLWGKTDWISQWGLMSRY